MSELRQQIFVAAAVVLFLGLAMWLVNRPASLSGDVPQVLVFAPGSQSEGGLYSRDKAIALAAEGDGRSAQRYATRPIAALTRGTQNVITQADVAMRDVATTAREAASDLGSGLLGTASLAGATLGNLNGVTSLSAERIGDLTGQVAGQVTDAVSANLPALTNGVGLATSNTVTQTMGASSAELRSLLTVEGFNFARLEAILTGRELLSQADEWILIPALRTAQSNPVVLQDTLNQVREQLGL
ncbi:MAG: hypothetical protein ACPGVS_09010 [Primorskyibacter sp.]